MAPVAKPFWGRVKRGRPDECWPWLGATVAGGYGQLRVGGKQTSAHRRAWEMHHKKKAGRWRIRHRCDNPPCCNPAHLFRGTHQQNMNESVKRGRRARLRGELNGNAVLTKAKVKWARANVGKHRGKKYTIREAEKILGCSKSQILRVINGGGWSCSTG